MRVFGLSVLYEYNRSNGMRAAAGTGSIVPSTRHRNSLALKRQKGDLFGRSSEFL